MKEKKILELIFDETGETNEDDDPILEEIKFFFNSLKLKSDSVGWCELDMSKSDSTEKLTSIKRYADQKNYKIRGTYYQYDGEFESEWYSLIPDIYDEYDQGFIYSVVEGRSKKKLEIPELIGYKIPKHSSLISSNPYILVSEKFKNFCINNNARGIDFYWVRDKGKYEATQFFCLLIENKISNFASDVGLSYDEDKKSQKKLKEKYNELGGIMPQIYNTFYNLRVHLPIIIPKSEIPKVDFTYVLWGRESTVLVHKDFAKKLLDDRIVYKKNLQPIHLYDIPPKGYTILPSGSLDYPVDKVINELYEEYKQLKDTPLPKYRITEKMALKYLRSVKKERKEDFSKAMPKQMRESLIGTSYERLIPIYMVCNGGDLSDEYYLLSYEKSKAETIVFFKIMEKEELLDNKPSGIVISQCADGDIIILSDDGIVNRVSHEEPEIIESWESLMYFIYDTLEG